MSTVYFGTLCKRFSRNMFIAKSWLYSTSTGRMFEHKTEGLNDVHNGAWMLEWRECRSWSLLERCLPRQLSEEVSAEGQDNTMCRVLTGLEWTGFIKVLDKDEDRDEDKFQTSFIQVLDKDKDNDKTRQNIPKTCESGLQSWTELGRSCQVL